MSGVKKRKAESGDRNLFNPSQAPRKSSSNISILRQLMEKKIANQGTDWQREPAKLVPLHQLAWQPEEATVHVCKECKKDQKRDVVFECGHVLVCVECAKNMGEVAVALGMLPECPKCKQFVAGGMKVHL